MGLIYLEHYPPTKYTEIIYKIDKKERHPKKKILVSNNKPSIFHVFYLLHRISNITKHAKCCSKLLTSISYHQHLTNETENYSTQRNHKKTFPIPIQFFRPQ